MITTNYLKTEINETISTKISPFKNKSYKPKLFQKAPSARVIENYNNISTEIESDAVSCGNLTFISEDGNGVTHEDEFGLNKDTSFNDLSGNCICADKEKCFCKMSSSYSNPALSSCTDIRKEDFSSTATLISPRVQKSCKTCLSYIETFLCTVSLAAGLGNIYRLPQNVVAHGGSVFLLAYVVLLIFVGVPLLFLELGIGQIIQDGFMKTWKAVPFFRGVGYVKLIAGCLLAIYYPLQMGLSLFYLVWFTKSVPPFNECAYVKMNDDGYKADGISGQECLQKTFLESPFEDPSWFGIYSSLLFLTWFVILACCIKRTKMLEKSLIAFLICTFACFVGLIYKVLYANEFVGIETMGEAKWELLGSADVWYYALLQVFYSTNIGFGVFTSNAGVIYKKVNPFITALGFTFISLFFGLISVFIFYTISYEIDPSPENSTIYEMHGFTHIYDVVVNSEDVDMQVWSVIAYTMYLFAGFLSVITIMYTIIKAINLETKNKLQWWKVCLIISIIGFICSCLTLLCPDLLLLHMLDQYLIGNLILITVILEVGAFLYFYGCEMLRSDFEFILGTRLSQVWLLVWCFIPPILLGIFLWGLSTLPLNGFLRPDPIWIPIIGWAIVAMAILLIIVLGFYNVNQQEKYLTLGDKFRASFKHLRNWGPSDPMMLHSYKQWHSKVQDGERDFTLKRRGTKEYTHSVKNRAKYDKTYNSTMSDSSTLTYKKGESLEQDDAVNFNDPYYLRNGYDNSLRVTSLVDAMDSTPVHTFTRPGKTPMGYKTNYNPLAYINIQNVNNFQENLNDGSTSEGYGTYRKGPYIIEDDGLEHVCHRRNSLHEQATEL